MGIWVGRYAIVAGEVREHGPWLVERRGHRDDEDLRLLVLVDPVDDRSAELAPEVAEAVAEIFTGENLSITGGLLRALRQAHINLAEWNRRSLREHRVAVGLTCVAVRGGEVTIAQVGPGVVYIAGPEGVRRLATDDEEAARPLGGTEPVEPQFFSTRLHGRTLLLLTGAVDQIVGSSTIGEALRAGPDRTLAELYRRTRGVEDMTAAVIVETPEGFDIDEDDGRPSATILELHPEAEPDRADALLREITPDVEAGVANTPLLLPPPPMADAPARERDSDAADERTAEPPPERPVLVSVPREPETPVPVDSGVRREDEGQLGFRQRMPKLRRQTSSYPPARAAGQPPASRGASAGPTGSRRLPAVPGSNRLRGYILIGVVIAAALLLAVCTLPGILNEDRGARLDDAIVAAQEHIAAAAEATADASVARAQLHEAGTDIARGRSIAPDDTRLDALQEQVNDALARLDAVVDLGEDLRTVLTFDGAITAPFTPDALALGGGSLWLVDGQRGRVLAVPEDGAATPNEVYRLDSTYGDVLAREPGAIAWDREGNRLLILDAARNLFALAPGDEPEPVAVRGIGELRSTADIASYDGNLYILDAAGGEIWRYLPAGAGYDSERTGILNGVEIPDARTFVVNGEFYILGASGVRHFRQDRELPTLFTGIDRPISSPAGLAVDGLRLLVYVADRGGRRVVVSSSEGPYLKQYRHPQFFDIRGLTLAPDGAGIYVLTGDGVYTFSPS
ncbi:MAG: hypothetical protein AB7L91_14140 [Dehalococcoidia bacterium]